MTSIFSARPFRLNFRSHVQPISNFRAVSPSILKFRSNALPVLSFSSLQFHLSNSKNNKGFEVVGQRTFHTSATGSTDRNSIKEEKEKDESKATSGAQGPPFLTIIAGLAVFSLICWIIGSVLMSLIGLLVKLIASN